MTSILDDDDDLADLVAESMALVSEKDAIAKARKKLSDPRTSPTDREELSALVSAYDEARLWETVAQVALIHVQPCLTCGHAESMFQGWFLEQRHRSQPTTRRLVSGESPTRLPMRKERHHLKGHQQCTHCIDSYIRVRQAVVPFTLPKRKGVKDD